MPLQMQMVPGGGDKLIVVCDHCGAEIPDAQAGWYLSRYDPRDGTPQGGIFFTHHECEAAFTEQGGHQDWGWCSGELASLPVEIALALGIDWNEAKWNEVKQQAR
jgi:hypothetical protein